MASVREAISYHLGTVYEGREGLEMDDCGDIVGALEDKDELADRTDEGGDTGDVSVALELVAAQSCPRA